MIPYPDVLGSYQHGLDRGLGTQFQLATQAQPVTQFLQGLSSARQYQMQQRQMDQTQQRWDQDRSYRTQRDAMNDDRYRDIADIQSEDRRMGMEDRASENKRRAQAHVMDIYEKTFDGDPAKVPAMKSLFESVGLVFPTPHKSTRSLWSPEQSSDPEAVDPNQPVGLSGPEGGTVEEESYAPGSLWGLKDAEHRRKLDHGETMEGLKGRQVSLQEDTAAKMIPAKVTALNAAAERSRAAADKSRQPPAPPKDNSQPSANTLFVSYTREIHGKTFKGTFEDYKRKRLGGGGAPSAPAQKAPPIPAGTKTRLADGEHPAGGYTYTVKGGVIVAAR